MKLQLLHKDFYSNVKCLTHKQRQFIDIWHYHPELELVYIRQGNGVAYIGDYIGEFHEGDFFLLGSNLPHVFKSDPNLQQDSEALILFLNPEFLKKLARLEKEFSFLEEVLTNSQYGIKFKEFPNELLKEQLLNLLNKPVSTYTLHALAILSELNVSSEYDMLSGIKCLKNIDLNDKRFRLITEYTMVNLEQEIELDSVAALVGMNKSAFCRFFKQKTGKTYVTYLNEARINRACKILKLEKTKNVISQACFKSGFNNLSYFNRIFKKAKGVTPSEYMTDLHVI